MDKVMPLAYELMHSPNEVPSWQLRNLIAHLGRCESLPKGILKVVIAALSDAARALDDAHLRVEQAGELLFQIGRAVDGTEPSAVVVAGFLEG